MDVERAEVSESDRKDSCFETKDSGEGEKDDNVENSSLNGGNLENAGKKWSESEAEIKNESIWCGMQ